MSTIPASNYVNVTPGVIGAGGSAIDLLGLMLTTSARIPIGTVPSFASADAVGEYFGAGSGEKALADVYFKGFDNSDVKPGAMLMAQYNTTAVAAFLRGGNAGATLTLAQLQALAVGTLSLVMDGYTHAGAGIDLSGATSFSSAASIISAALNASQPVQASFTGAIAGTTLTVSALGSGVLAVGQTLAGVGITAATRIVALGSGTGGTGTYTVNNTQTVGSEAMTSTSTPVVVAYDSVSGGFTFTSGITGAPSTAAFATGSLAASLLLTSATGAVISQGAAIAVPGTFMDHVLAVTQNWATFFTAFDPDVTGFANKLLFAQWADAQDNRYGYAAWDTDSSPKTQAPATGSFGYAVRTTYDLTGVSPIASPDASIAAFECGIGASVDFARPNGRTTFSYRSQSGLVASATTDTEARNLEANGYNYYGAVATANEGFQYFYAGVISGPFRWMDSFINQIWLNNAFQLALLTMLTVQRSIPYNTAGNAIIEASLGDAIAAGLNFGAYRAGVSLSSSQRSEVNTEAGADIAPTLTNRGWYLQVLPASPTVRAERGSPPCKFWYMDGESVQRINLNSVNVL